MIHSEKISAIAAALAKAQKSFAVAERDAENPYYDSTYSTMKSVVEACRTSLADAAISVVQATENDGDMIVVETMLMHESGEWIKTSLRVRPMLSVVDSGKNGGVKEKAITPQSIGSAATYACRYALRSLLVIATDEDDDGNSASGVSKKTSQVDGSFEDVITDIIEKQGKARTGKTFTIFEVVTGDHGVYKTFDKGLVNALAKYKGSGQVIIIDGQKTQYGFDIVGFSEIQEGQKPAELGPLPPETDIRAVLGSDADLVQDFLRSQGSLLPTQKLYDLNDIKMRKLFANPDGAIKAAKDWRDNKPSRRSEAA